MKIQTREMVSAEQQSKVVPHEDICHHPEQGSMLGAYMNYMNVNNIITGNNY
jgi:hypothetical protein